MKNTIEERGVCGFGGCSIGVTNAAPGKGAPAERRQMHDLTIVSDVICPWCFLAKKNLDKALELTDPKLPVEITWRPFELNPTMPKGGIDRREYRSKKFGSWARSQVLDAQVAEAGARAGITFRHDLMARTPNTLQAHRLIWLAGEKGLQDGVVEALFRAYFTEGRDVSETSVLIEIAARAGIDKEHASAFLSGTVGTDEVRFEAQTAMSRGISGVPTFILDGEAIFSGALKPDLMAVRLREAVFAHEKQ